MVQIRSQNHRKFVRPQHPNTLLEPHQASRMHRPLATAKIHRITESSQNWEPNVEVRQDCQRWPAEHASTRLLSVYSVLPASTSFPLALSLSLSADLQPPLQVKLLISDCEFTDLILCGCGIQSNMLSTWQKRQQNLAVSQCQKYETPSCILESQSKVRKF